MRFRAKVDANQSTIVAHLRRAGCTVQSLAAVGKGCPDILVGYQGYNFTFEVKDGDLPPSHRRLTSHESQWHAMWKGQVGTILTADEALTFMRKAVEEDGCQGD